MTGMVALGFVSFMQRMNEEDGIYESSDYEAPQPFDDGPDQVPAMVDLDDGDVEEDDDDLEIEVVDDTADVETEPDEEQELKEETEESRLRRKNVRMRKRSLKTKKPSSLPKRWRRHPPLRKNHPNKNNTAGYWIQVKALLCVYQKMPCRTSWLPWTPRHTMVMFQSLRLGPTVRSC